MAKEIVKLRGHHLRILYDYAYFAYYHKDNPKLRKFRTELKDERVIESATESGHSKKHGINATKVLKKAVESGVRIKLTDTLDDICATCNDRNKKSCKEFIPYDISAAADDRGTLHYYGLKKREYASEFIIKRLLKKGKEP